jgi:homogentisate 1,2-dioxygenase
MEFEMPFYVRSGDIPRKRHVQFRGPEGQLRYEELVSRKGFSGVYSNLYHLRMPTRVRRVLEFEPRRPVAAGVSQRARHIRTGRMTFGGDAIASRRLLLFNADVSISKAHIDRAMDHLFRNGHHDELYYIQQGAGVMRTNFGSLAFGPGDYLVVPRGVIYAIEPDGKVKALVIESRDSIETPARYRSEHGQLLEHSPFCERDIRTPVFEPPIDQEGAFLVEVRLEGGAQKLEYAHHPFDVVGWDGYYYPWAINIRDFEPITGRIHQPPPVHQMFQARGFVVCSFVSRLFDYHPEAVPAPYPHSNVDSDEVIFYSWGQFMSRKGIEPESITLHPMGLPHGPQPGRYEDSIGKRETQELAVMIDTFAPLAVAEAAMDVDDPSYPLSWLG